MSGRGAVTTVTGLRQWRWSPSVVVVAVVGGLLTVSWVAAAVAMSTRGFDITDEGYYVLSYRWWSSNPRNASGVQYIYGPLFQALGYSIPGLRIARLVSVLGLHLVFAWSFLRWLRVRRPDVLAAPGTSWAVALTLTATGGITYGWLPLSPGYNDVAMLGSLVMASAVLCTVAGAAAHRRLLVLPALALGPALILMVLAKWAAAGVVLAFVAVIAVWAVRPWRPSGTWRFLAVGTAGVLASLTAVDVFVKPFSEMLPPMLAVTRRVAASANSPSQLLPMYMSTSAQVVASAMVIILVGAPVVALGVVLGRRFHRTLGLVVVAFGPVVATILVSPRTWGLPGGGVGALPRYSAVMVAMALVVGGVAVHQLLVRRGRSGVERPTTDARSGRISDLAVVVLLLLMPLVQALGTGNALFDLAVNQLVCWVALMVLTVLVVPRDSWTHVLAAAATAVAVVVAATTGADGLLAHPYRTAGWARSTVAVGGNGPLAGLKTSPAEATTIQDVRASAGASPRPGRPVFAFDELAGLVLALDGTSVGEPWYSAIDPRRTAQGIRSECRDQRPVDDRDAVVLFSRPPEAGDLKALASCGLGIRTAVATIPLFGRNGQVSAYRLVTVTRKEGP